MISLARGKGENSVNICAFEIRVFFKDCLSRLAGRQETQNIGNGYAQVANARTTVHAAWVYRYSRQKLGHAHNVPDKIGPVSVDAICRDAHAPAHSAIAASTNPFGSSQNSRMSL